MKLKSITIQNFKSYGNKKTRIQLDDHEGLTLIMGKNEDSTDEDARNGCGKSSFFDALKWVLTNKTIKPAKPPSAIINRANGKKALVSLEFELNGFDCIIERGLKPGVCRFWKKPLDADGDVRSDDYDCTKDSIANTTKDIIDFTRIDADIFNLVVVSAAKTDNFFDMDAAGQRSVIEMLFGYTVLSQKAEVLKEMKKQRETDLALEKARLEERKGQYERNKAKLESLRLRSDQWSQNNKTALSDLVETIDGLSEIDYDLQGELLDEQDRLEKEITEAHRVVNEATKEHLNFKNQVLDVISLKLSKAQTDIERVKQIDVDAFLEAYDTYESDKKQTEAELSEAKSDLSELQRSYEQFQKELRSLTVEVDTITDTCPTCGQSWPDADAREQKIADLQAKIEEVTTNRNELDSPIESLQFAISELKLVKHDKPTEFPSRDAAVRAASDRDNARNVVKELRNEMVEAETKEDELETAVQTAKDQLATAKDAKSAKDFSELLLEDRSEIIGYKTTLTESIKQREKLETDVNPYLEDITELEAEVETDFDTSSIINIENDIKAHTDLINLLTKKDSPIRREITAVKLPALNKFVAEYLDALDLPYIIRFNDDLTPSTFDFDQEGSFSVMSSGEEERVGIALSWAFRDLFEKMNFPINFYGIDERIDAGMDGSGAERAVAILYEMAQVQKRNIFLISHRKEMVDYADRIMITTKKNRYTNVEFE